MHGVHAKTTSRWFETVLQKIYLNHPFIVNLQELNTEEAFESFFNRCHLATQFNSHICALYESWKETYLQVQEEEDIKLVVIA